MARYLANLTNGQIDEKGFLRLFGVLLNQSGVLQSGALAVAQQSTPDMSVKVAGAVTGHDIIFIGTDGAVYHGWNTADETVLISSNASGVTKTDAIVAYADLTAGIATSNNPGALKFVAVRRSGSNTGAPTSGEISTAVSSNPYVVLAHVTVSNGASSINSGNLTDQRPRTQLAESNYGAGTIPAAAIKSEAWTSYTPSLTAAGGSPAIGNGTLSGRYTRVGRTVTVHAELAVGSSTNLGTGAIRVSLPVAPAANQHIGMARIYDQGNPHYVGLALNYSGNQWCDFWPNAASLNVSATVPFTFGAGDGVRFTITYEAAI